METKGKFDEETVCSCLCLQNRNFNLNLSASAKLVTWHFSQLNEYILTQELRSTCRFPQFSCICLTQTSDTETIQMNPANSMQCKSRRSHFRALAANLSSYNRATTHYKYPYTFPHQSRKSSINVVNSRI